ncbi:MAG: serine hydrolase domain-containing protein [Roseobacter sp.]|jgi:D-alanyl-D-alanine carboxypeptidase|nr:serine hydrolase domain-containing protein [Roseobacter sp.]
MSNYHPFLNALVSIGACLVVTTFSLPANAQLAQNGTCSAISDAPVVVEEELDGVLRQMLESTHGSAPGAVLSVRTDDWHYIAAAGFADPEAGTPLDCASPFQIGSNTKMMTAVVLLQLVEAGRVGLDDPLSLHLPEIAERLPNGEAMTFRQLARHTSGVFSYTDNASDGTPGLMEGGLTDRAALVRQIDPQEMIDFVVEHGAPNFLPDAEGKWSYSNTGYALLGLVIEKLDGRPIEKSYEERIFGPLGMDRTYLWRGVPKDEFGLPRAYFIGTENEMTDWNLSQGWSAGGVISTVEDMHDFIEALIGGDLFLSAETLRLMQETVEPKHSLYLAYGVGLGLKGRDLWGHGGQTLGYASDIVAGPNFSLVAFGTSANNSASFAAGDVTEALQNAGAFAE